MSALRPAIPLKEGRSLSKETTIEPDWSLAYEDLDGDDMFIRERDKDLF